MMNAPFQGFPPEILAKMAQGAFRPPGAGGGMMAPQQQTPGFNMAEGMAGLGMGLGAWKPNGTIKNAGPQGAGPGGAYTTADAMGMAGLNDGMTLSPMNPSYGDLGGPGMAQPGGGFGDWWARNFGGGGS